MTTLKDIKGDQIRYLDEDPTLAGGAWASGGNLNTTRAGGGGAGVQTAVIAISGIVTNAPAVSTVNNESYDGSTWTEVNNVNTARLDTHAVGSATAALLFGGQPPFVNTTESWDGTNWTTVSSLNTPRGTHTGFGTSTAGLCISGLTAGDTLTGNVESWNGSAWTEITDVNQGRGWMSSSTNAPQSDGIVFGGTIFPGPTTAATESWNGSAWTEVNDLNTAITNGSGAGTSTSALMIAGANPTPALTNTTQSWDGTDWSTSSDQANSLFYKNRGGGGASNSVAITFSGSNSPSLTTPTFVSSTEEFSFPPTSLTFLQEGMMWFNSTSQTLKGYGTAAGIPAGTWASGGNLNTARAEGQTFGTQSAAIYAGGEPPRTAVTEEYNGTSWTAVTSLPVARSQGASLGVLTAGLIAAGFIGTPPATTTATSLLYDGTNWTFGSNINTARNSNMGGAGTQTSGLIFAGFNPSPNANSALTETWNGTSWTEVSDLNNARRAVGGLGLQTAALCLGGYESAESNLTEEYNGTSWTNVGTLNTARYGMATSQSGTVSSALAMNGHNGTSPQTVTEYYNGTSWTELNDTSTARSYTRGAGTALSCITVGGSPAPAVGNQTEEWTAAATVVTFTTS